MAETKNVSRRRIMMFGCGERKFENTGGEENGIFGGRILRDPAVSSGVMRFPLPVPRLEHAPPRLPSLLRQIEAIMAEWHRHRDEIRGESFNSSGG
ncbi:MAG: hypothetical protein ACYC5H_12605 [Methylovirgula sp.]